MPGSSSTSGAAAGAYAPDLWAKGMNITAYYETQRVYASGVVENIGLGAAFGPFIIQVAITIDSDDGTSEYAQNFLVPEGAIITGQPIFTQVVVQPQAESNLVRPPTAGGEHLQNTYVTGQMNVPLLFNDIPPHAIYTAGFNVDVYGQVTNDYNWANNIYSRPGHFWFMSLEAQEREGVFVIERGRKRSIE
jgi:hypothetical protein